MRILIDQDVKGDTDLLWGTLAATGWAALLAISFVTFEEASLPLDSDDRTVWRYAQNHQLILLTANRNMKGEGSLEQTLREESSPMSFPVVTVSNRNRLRERAYRLRCIERLVEIVMYLDAYRGTNRIFIP